MRDPVSDLGPTGKAVFAATLIFALLHALLYVAAIPAWDLFDEEQHLSYAIYLREDGAIPHVTDPVQPAIIDNAAVTDRWSAFRIGRPDSLEAGEMGLEGLSYEGYQPPLYYALLVPVTWLAEDDVWRELYLARLTGLVFILGIAGVTWGYAREWFAGESIWVWGSAVVVTTAVPAMAAAAGRVNNDLLAALFVSSGLLMAIRLLNGVTGQKAVILGALGAAAVLTKMHGVLLLALIALTLLILYRQQRLDRVTAAVTVLPGALATAGWTLWTYNRYGTLTGSGAFLDLTTPFDPLPVREFAANLWLNGWSSYWGAYDGGWLRIATGVLLGLVAVVAAAGITRAGIRRSDLLLTATLAGGLIVTLWIANQGGLVHPHGRILLPVYPALGTLVAGGWSRWFGTGGAVAVAAIIVGASVFYFGYWFYPFFHGDIF